MDKSENELAGIVSTAKTCVNLYNDPLIAIRASALDLVRSQKPCIVETSIQRYNLSFNSRG